MMALMAAIRTVTSNGAEHGKRSASAGESMNKQHSWWGREPQPFIAQQRIIVPDSPPLSAKGKEEETTAWPQCCVCGDASSVIVPRYPGERKASGAAYCGDCFPRKERHEQEHYDGE